jgi:hypothetical protein
LLDGANRGVYLVGVDVLAGEGGVLQFVAAASQPLQGGKRAIELGDDRFGDGEVPPRVVGRRPCWASSPVPIWRPAS